MKCVFCKQGETLPGSVFISLRRESTLVVIKDVPANVCDNCQEYYLAEEVTAQVLAKAEEAVRRGAEIEVIGFAA